MAITYTEDYATTVAKALGDIKQRILASSDWAHLAVVASTSVATSTVAAGATSFTVASAVNISVGTVITFWRNAAINGATAPESRAVTAVSGTTISWTDALTAPGGTYQVGDAVGVGAYVKATTTRGAQMVIDLAGAAITAQRIQMTVYRTHDGTTGADAQTRYLYWKSGVGATTDIVRVTVSAGKEHVYLSVEGPHANETNTENVSFGSFKQQLLLCDIVPYFSSTYDNVPAVCLVANSSAGTSNQSRICWVSRDAANVNSWVQASLFTLAYPTDSAATQRIQTWQPIGLDGSLVTFPWVVMEDVKGIRGSLARCFYGGNPAVVSAGDPLFIQPGMEEAYGGVTYRGVVPQRNGTTAGGRPSYGFGDYGADSSGAVAGPILFVPKA